MIGQDRIDVKKSVKMHIDRWHWRHPLYLKPNLEHFVACSKVWEGFLGSLPVPAAIYWPRHWAYWMRFWSSIRLLSLKFRWLEMCLQLMRMNNIHHHNHLYHSKERDICNNLFGFATGDSWCGSLGRAGQNFSSVSWLDLVSIDFVSMVKH